MHRPARGGAALVVFAPFSLAVARLHCPARLALVHLPAWVGGQAGWVACPSNAIPAGLPLRGNCFQVWLARASALRASASCAASPSSSSALRAEASSSCMLSFKGCANAALPSFSRFVPTDYRPAKAGFVLSDIPLRGKTEIFFLRVTVKRKCAPINCFHYTPSLRSLSLW